MAAPSAKRIALIALGAAVPLDAVLIRSHGRSALEESSGERDREVNQTEALMRRNDADRAIYNKHWWPLEPPPYHHPGKNPLPKELQAAQALEENYTKYWRTLPKFNASAVLFYTQMGGYLKHLNWTTAARMQAAPAGSPAAAPNGSPALLEYILHHKTGENLHTNIDQALPRKHFNTMATYEPMQLDADPGRRRLHFIRDPVDVIASGYRYHQNKWGGETWSWGHRRLQDPQCFECDNYDHYAMFDSCHFNCTYFELLNRLEESSGVIVEALSARRTLLSMASTMSLLSNASDTLHLSVDLFRANATQTTACMLKFLGLDGNATVQEKMVKAVQKVSDPDHVTSGLYDNTAIKAQLRSHGSWGPEFREINELKDRIFRRQAALWGCPEQEAADE